MKSSGNWKSKIKVPAERRRDAKLHPKTQLRKKTAQTKTVVSSKPHPLKYIQCRQYLDDITSDFLELFLVAKCEDM